MAERSLLIDQGNTRIKWLNTSDGDGDGDLGGAVAEQGDFAAFRRYCERSARPDRVLLSNVAGFERERAVADLCASLWSLEVRALRATTQQAGVRNAYESPGMLGVDRWLAIVGAAARYGMPVIVWDLGTAATLDAVDEDGRHLGGLILPGPATMLASLEAGTRLEVPASLHENGERDPATPGRSGAIEAGSIEGGSIKLGRSTAECISHGVLSAQLGAFELFRHNLRSALCAEPQIVVAGGAAAMLRERLPAGHIYDPLLVFRGMLTA